MYTTTASATDTGSLIEGKDRRRARTSARQRAIAVILAISVSAGALFAGTTQASAAPPKPHGIDCSFWMDDIASEPVYTYFYYYNWSQRQWLMTALYRTPSEDLVTYSYDFSRQSWQVDMRNYMVPAKYQYTNKRTYYYGLTWSRTQGYRWHDLGYCHGGRHYDR